MPGDNNLGLTRRAILRAGAVTGAVSVTGLLRQDDDSEFDPELPELASTLVENDWDFGQIEELEGMEPRDEPRYGDPPMEASEDEYQDPDPLVFTWAPTEDPAGYEDTFDLLEENLETELDRSVDVFIVEDYAAQVEAMRANRLHLARFSTGNTPFGVNIGGAVPFSMPVAEGGLFGTKSWLITRAENDEINELADIEGKRIAHGSAGSNSGTLAPQALWEDEGIVPGEDYEFELTGGHEQATLAVYQGDFDAGSVCSHCFKRAMQGRNLDLSEIKVVWSTDAFPLGPFSYRFDLHPDVVEGIQRALYEYDYENTALHEDLGFTDFIEIDYATHWDTVLRVQEANDVEYTEEEL